MVIIFNQCCLWFFELPKSIDLSQKDFTTLGFPRVPNHEIPKELNRGSRPCAILDPENPNY